MKIYYNQQTQRFEVSHLGELIDHDTDMNVLMSRQGLSIDGKENCFDLLSSIFSIDLLKKSTIIVVPNDID